MPSQKGNYYFYLDESGDHGLTFIDPHFSIFLLAGCLFSSEELNKITREISIFKQEFFKSSHVILHSRDIRKCEGSFQILFDIELKKRFYQRLNEIITQTQFQVISVAIDKKKHIEKYGKVAGNPYTICLSYILERLVFCTDQHSNMSTVAINIEQRGKKKILNSSPTIIWLLIGELFTSHQIDLNNAFQAFPCYPKEIIVLVYKWQTYVHTLLQDMC